MTTRMHACPTVPAESSSPPGPASGASSGRHRRAGHAGRDAGHEAVGQALLISIGLAGMLAATKLAAISMDGIVVVMDALR